MSDFENNINGFGAIKEPIMVQVTMFDRLDGGGVMLWATFYRETLDPDIHVDVTFICTTFLNIVVLYDNGIS